MKQRKAQREIEMAQITVYHHLIVSEVEQVKPIIYPVAFSDKFGVDELEAIFKATNTIDEAWVSAADSRLGIAMRSTSVGDVVKVTDQLGTIDAKWFQVEPIGWVEVSRDDFRIAAPVTREMSDRFINDPEFAERAKNIF